MSFVFDIANTAPLLLVIFPPSKMLYYTVNFAYNDSRRPGHQKSVLIREVSFYPKSHYNYVLQLDGTLLWT